MNHGLREFWQNRYESLTLCLGMMTYGSKKWREWVLEEEEARPFVKRALEAGINFFDTADVYSLGASEEVLGKTLRTLKAPPRKPGDRHQSFQPHERRSQ